MSSLKNQDWLMLPDLIFEDIMMMIDLDSLCHCRKVCSTWNAKIMSNIWGNPSKKNILTRCFIVLTLLSCEFKGDVEYYDQPFIIGSMKCTVTSCSVV